MSRPDHPFVVDAFHVDHRRTNHPALADAILPGLVEAADTQRGVTIEYRGEVVLELVPKSALYEPTVYAELDELRERRP